MFHSVARSLRFIRWPMLCGLLALLTSIVVSGRFAVEGAIAQTNSTAFDSENAATLYISVMHPDEVQVRFGAALLENITKSPKFEVLSELQLQNAAQAMLNCAEGDWDVSSEEGIRIWGQCKTATRTDWGWAGRIDLAPLLSVASDLSIPYIEAQLRVPDIGQSEISPPGASLHASFMGIDEEAEGLFADAMERFDPNSRIYEIAVASPDVTEITYRYGFRLRRVVLDLLGLLGVLVMASGLQIALRNRALTAHVNNADAPIWFSYQRYRSWLEIATWFVWVGAVSFSEVLSWQTLFLPSQLNELWLSALTLAWFFVPPLLIGIFVQCLSFRVMKVLSELDYTLSEMLKQYLSTQGVWFAIFLMISAAPFALGGEIGGVLVLLVAATVMLLLRRFNKKMSEMTPYAITTGELRDRVFEIAKPTGVKLQQLYLVPKQRSRMVNAFAVKNNTVMVTDYLLKSLSKDEVDGVMAHEIAHLQLGHPQKLLWQVVGTCLVTMWSLQAVTLLTMFFVPWAAVVAVPLVLSLAGYLFYSSSRRYEYQADAQAVLLTDNPQSLITGLVKVARFNQMPLQWGRWGEAWMTHPSMMRRVSAIAERYNLPAGEVDTLLENAQQDVPTVEKYSLTTVETAAVPPLFSSQFQQKTSQRLSWLVILCFSLLPAILGRFASLLPTPGLRYVGFGTAAIVVFSVYFYLVNVGGTWGFGSLQKQLAARLHAEGIDPSHGTFVGLSPSSDLRLYEGCTEWDVGFLFVENGRLFYVGERVRFALNATKISQMTLQIEKLEWISQGSIGVTWQADDLTAQTFRLQMLSMASVKASVREARSLLEKIESGLTANSDGDLNSSDGDRNLNEALQSLQSPTIRDVTSQPFPAFTVGAFFSLWITRIVCGYLSASLFLSPGAVFGFVFLMATTGTMVTLWPTIQRSMKH